MNKTEEVKELYCRVLEHSLNEFGRSYYICHTSDNTFQNGELVSICGALYGINDKIIENGKIMYYVILSNKSYFIDLNGKITI